VNELLRVPFDFCVPSVGVENHTMEVTDQNGKPNHILLMHVLPSSQVIANQADDVFLRIGDKSKKLNFEQRLQLVYAKGVKYFEDQPVSGASLADLDLSVVQQYCDRLGYSKGDAEHYLRHNHDFVSSSDGADKISAAAILLFGKDPQRFFPRARIRFVRYEGDKENGLDPYRYLTWLLNEAPKLAVTDSDWAALLVPQNAPLLCRAHLT